ncbi:hypothetical protein [Chryseobacterium indoltheticum]|uniref:hypothetical protein n=1 Tax=Chryseobacterium indoltheticum TaxID=254 RepID=UPI003F49866A
MPILSWMRSFGKVPLIDHPVSPEEAATIQRTDLATLYNFITSEIESSIGGLKIPTIMLIKEE